VCRGKPVRANQPRRQRRALPRPRAGSRAVRPHRCSRPASVTAPSPLLAPGRCVSGEAGGIIGRLEFHVTRQLWPPSVFAVLDLVPSLFPDRRFVLPAETPALPPDAGGFGRDGPSTQGWGPCWEQPPGAAVASRGSFLRFPRWSLLERDGPSTSVSAVLGPRRAWALGGLGALGVLPSSSGPSGGGTGGVSEAFSDPAGWWELCKGGALGRPFLGGATER